MSPFLFLTCYFKKFLIGFIMSNKNCYEVDIIKFKFCFILRSMKDMY
jgi:hypothetical protein